jgi:hypothetical protein
MEEEEIATPAIVSASGPAAMLAFQAAPMRCGGCGAKVRPLPSLRDAKRARRRAGCSGAPTTDANNCAGKSGGKRRRQQPTRAPTTEASSALPRGICSKSRAVGGRPPESPLRPARSHMCSGAHVRPCSGAHVLSHTCTRPHRVPRDSLGAHIDACARNTTTTFFCARFALLRSAPLRSTSLFSSCALASLAPGRSARPCCPEP